MKTILLLLLLASINCYAKIIEYRYDCNTGYYETPNFTIIPHPSEAEQLIIRAKKYRIGHESITKHVSIIHPDKVYKVDRTFLSNHLKNCKR
jgi:hypothetical protein